MSFWAFIHSPLVGPFTWSLVAHELRRRGFEAIIPELRQQDAAGEPYWSQHSHAAAEVVRAIPQNRPVILAGHSGAGPLLPAVRQAADRPVSAYIFVDAGLPEDGRKRIDDGPFGAQIRELYARGERFPNWTNESLRVVVPDPLLRRRLLAEMRSQPLGFWEEPIPVFAGWPEVPCAYLRFGQNPAYDAAVADARRRGWPCADLPGSHFHMLVDPIAVTDALLDLLSRIGV